ncbi:helix-turn-helix domain-containing protein [Xenorhabdus doucetiae]|uniref:helix-turn-helix domain-containing protein n=1 Tax=Xenorhabdus doucetiae TaxID=351671 RepID=UPI0038CD24F9
MMDNLAHKALFTIPEPTYSTELATVKPLPVQRKITGNKQVDAYLWVLEVIKTNEPAHLEAAEEALKKLKITPKAAQQKYSDYLMKSGAHAFQIAFGTMSMDNPQGYINRAKEQIRKASQVRGLFGSYEQALDDCEAERLMKSSRYYISDPCFGWTEEEKRKGSISGSRVFEVDDLRKEKGGDFTDVLPEPHTLSDIVRELQYWDWLYSVRDSAAKELGWEYGYPQHDDAVYDRENYLEKQLTRIQAVNRQEAIDVCKWVLSEGRFDDRSDLTDRIILNLVGECAV